MSVIEKYLMDRKYHHVIQSASGATSSTRDVTNRMSDDDDSDDVTSDGDDSEIEESMLSRSAPSSAPSGDYKLQLFIGSHLISPKSTIYQSVKEHSKNGAFSKQTAESNQAFWASPHTVLYKQIPVDKANKRGKDKNGGKSKHVTFSFATGKLKWQPTLINKYLLPNNDKTDDVTIDSSLNDDDSFEALSLLKVMYGLCKHWHMLYSATSKVNTNPLISLVEFEVGKLAAKCQRQVQDPLMIVTGSVPSWVNDLARVFPFTLPFTTRQMIFRVLAMDRERAIHYLIDSGKMAELNNKNEQSIASATSRGDRFKNSRLEKKKFTIERAQLLHQAMKIISEHAHKKQLIEVEYQGESGTGKGPIQEFYTLVSTQLQREDLKMWRGDSFEASSSELKSSSDVVMATNNNPEPTESYVHSQCGLFPLPATNNKKNKNQNEKFTFLGKLMAKTLMDNRLLDVTLSPVFYKWLLTTECGISWHDFSEVDVDFSLQFGKLIKLLHNREVNNKINMGQMSDVSMEPPVSNLAKKKRYNSKKKKNQKVEKELSKDLLIDGCNIEDLMLDFQISNSQGDLIELCKNGKNMGVTLDNLDKYVNLLCYWTLHEGIKHQMEAVRNGFNSVLPLKTLQYFYPDELDQLFCGESHKQWTYDEISSSCKTGHGYTRDSPSVKNLYRVLASYNDEEQRKFLQFVTGCPTLPIGGLSALSPQLTIVRKTCGSSDDFVPSDVTDKYLPSVMTCVNYLKLPDYSTLDVLREQLKVAVAEGQQAFLLS